jgi:hypothetical protein
MKQMRMAKMTTGEITIMMDRVVKSDAPYYLEDSLNTNR